MAPSPRRLADQRRIRIATMLMASGALVGTGVFEGLAAAATHTKSRSTDGSTQSDDLSSSFSAPTQSYSPPVAQSGGS